MPLQVIRNVYTSHLSQDNQYERPRTHECWQVLNEHDIDTEKEVLLCDTDKAQATTDLYTIIE